MAFLPAAAAFLPGRQFRRGIHRLVMPAWLPPFAVGEFLRILGSRLSSALVLLPPLFGASSSHRRASDLPFLYRPGDLFTDKLFPVGQPRRHILPLRRVYRFHRMLSKRGPQKVRDALHTSCLFCGLALVLCLPVR